jgi:hypothetical protein
MMTSELSKTGLQFRTPILLQGVQQPTGPVLENWALVSWSGLELCSRLASSHTLSLHLYHSATGTLVFGAVILWVRAYGLISQAKSYRSCCMNQRMEDTRRWVLWVCY